MNQSRLAIKVGIFVALCITLLAALLMSFSKGFSVFTPTYGLDLKAESVGGLKKNAKVLLSGVPVGKVDSFDIAPSGKGVVIHLRIERRYQDHIHGDARFAIEQLGLLGDQYVEISPNENKAPPLAPGASIEVEEPLSIQGTARSAKGLIEQAGATLKNINDVLNRANNTVLSEQSLSNAAVSLDKFRLISERAADMVDQINRLVQTNGPIIAFSFSNLSRFSIELDKLSADMSATIATNRYRLNLAMNNLEAASAALQRLANEVEAGKGLAGLLIKDEQIRAQFASTVTNLAVFSRSLREHGLLHNLFFKPKEPKPAAKTK